MVGRIGRIFVLLSVATPIISTKQFADVRGSDPRDHFTIYRDRYGVPHIVGDTEVAAFFGYGYAQAEDHLERMMLQYRDAQGRRSEVLGQSALGGPLLVYNPRDYRWDGDYLQRLLRTWQAVHDKRHQIDPAVYAVLTAFAEGINCYIAEHRARIPSWIDSVTPEDIEALQRSNYLRYYSIADALSKINGPPAPLPKLGSNHWAVSAKKSATNRVLHVEEIHMPWSNRFQMYEAHLVVPGKLNAGGISWFGSPLFLSGFNRDITWSITYNQPNISDVYEETINPANNLEYFYDGQWKKITKTVATFKIKAQDGTYRIEKLPLYYTHHGPIVRFDPVHNLAYSVKLPNFEGVNYSTGLYSFLTTDSVFRFRQALSRQLIPRWNFLCTDRQHIYWVHNGVVPKRDSRYNWLKPVAGWTSRTEWQGYLPFSANPQLLDPPSGYIQNANNPPWVSTRESGIRSEEPASYYYSYPVKPNAGEEVLNARGERLQGVLGRPGERFTIQQMTSLAFDTYVLAADLVVPLIEQAASRHTDDPAASRAAQYLHKWNRRAEQKSIAYTYFFYWGKAYQQLYGGSFRRFDRYNRDGISRDSRWEQERAWTALSRAVADVEKAYGKRDVAWGDINRVKRNGTFPIDGTGLYDVLHPDYGPESRTGTIDCDDGWGHMMVVEEGSPKRIWSLLPYGESEDPESPHYNDMAKLHSQGRLKRFWTEPEEILQNTESVEGDRSRIRQSNY
jgi:acyl-homoserine-lactone acylase